MVFTIQLKPQRVAQEGQEQMNYLRDVMEELYMEQLNNIKSTRLPGYLNLTILCHLLNGINHLT